MTTRSDWMVEGKSYPVMRDKRNKLWWLLTSRRVETWDHDGKELTEVGEITQQTWRESFRWNIWMGSKLWRHWYRFSDERDACGCSRNRITRKSRGMCSDHLMEMVDSYIESREQYN